MKRLFAFFILFQLLSHFSSGQQAVTFSRDSILRKTVEQVVLFPQEKLYLQVDKSVYISGEKVWFRAWLVDAVLHKPVISQYVYVQLINPLDTVVNRIIVRQIDGALSGFIPLKENLPEGDYTICAYTENMKNLGKDYFFRKKIRVVIPTAAKIQTNVNFNFETEDRVATEIIFYDDRGERKLKPEGLKVSINGKPVKSIRQREDTVSFFLFNLQQINRRRVLYVENKGYGKYIDIPYSANDFEVSFFPEGGNLVRGEASVVAFKSLNSTGLPEIVTGRVVDSVGNEYARIETTHEGMGRFSLVPEEGRIYYAICKNEQGKEKRFKLPAVQKGIYSLIVKAIRKKLYISVIHSSDIQELKPLFLVLHTRGIVHYAALWDQNFSTISFDTEKFPSGVMQIILLDAGFNPLSERLVFCRNNDQAQVEFRTDRDNYNSRQPVRASLRVINNKEIPLVGAFSVSVTDDNDVRPDSSSTILTTLLLSSELRGNINNPAFYFQENNPKAQEALDLLMMTNGWRRYNIPEAITGKFSRPLYPPKVGMEIAGSVKRLGYEKATQNGKVTVLSWENSYFDETETDKYGHFSFNRIEFPDSCTFIVQALNRNGNNGVELFVDNNMFTSVSRLPDVVSDYRITPKANEVEKLSIYIAKADSKYISENGLRTINIGEVVIKGNAPEEKKSSYSFYMPKNSSSTRIMTADQIDSYSPFSLTDLIKYFPFTRAVEVDGQMKAIIERMSYRMPTGGPEFNYAALIIDDILINDYDLENVIEPSNIEKMAVLSGTQAILLGGDGAGGAIVITTKKGYKINNAKNYNIIKITPVGYQKPAEFYSPRYETSEQRNSLQPDLRTTIYWNPNVSISSTGEAMLDFYAGDASTTYSVVIEGVTSDGAIIQSVNRISRK